MLGVMIEQGTQGDLPGIILPGILVFERIVNGDRLQKIKYRSLTRLSAGHELLC
ncbi:MAG: hypothetical protein AAFR31_05970 [Cyanobacteria bacterium J06627_8]